MAAAGPRVPSTPSPGALSLGRRGHLAPCYGPTPGCREGGPPCCRGGRVSTGSDPSRPVQVRNSCPRGRCRARPRPVPGQWPGGPGSWLPTRQDTCPSRPSLPECLSLPALPWRGPEWDDGRAGGGAGWGQAVASGRAYCGGGRGRGERAGGRSEAVSVKLVYMAAGFVIPRRAYNDLLAGLRCSQKRPAGSINRRQSLHRKPLGRSCSCR